MSFIKINGKPYPSPGLYPNMVVTTTVNAGRNANNKVVGQKISRDNYKIDNLSWPYLDAATWSSMLKEFENFFVTVEFWDMVNNSWKTLRYINLINLKKFITIWRSAFSTSFFL